ncbi:MAG: RNA methyltransferase [Endomicrobium sp.]|jgi:TrmH family RNA methyltransferase|nr:RNA methyltransferase [Endomicrobium sp.]
MIIESAQNKIFKEAMSLKEKKYRQKNGLFLVEGQKQTEEISGNWHIDSFFISKTFSKKNQFKTNIKSFIIADSLFKKLSSTQTPQGIIAVIEKKSYDIENIFKEDGFFIILEKMQDPGNLGTIIRSADAFGAKGIFVSKGSADIYSDKVIRSTMGSFFHLPIIDECDIQDIIKLMKKEKVKIFAASLDAKTGLKDIVFPTKSVIIIGNESKGLSLEIQKKANALIKIEMCGNAESLNAAAAAAIIMYRMAFSYIKCNIFAKNESK